MRILNTIRYWQLKSFTKGICRAMSFSFNVKLTEEEKKGGGSNLNYADITAKALCERPRWKQVKPRVFEYSTFFKYPIRVRISKKGSLASVTLSVIMVEMEDYICSDSDPKKTLDLIINTFSNYFKIDNESFEALCLKSNVEEYFVVLGKIQLIKYNNRQIF